MHTVQIESNRYDEATLRLACAGSMVVALQCLIEGGCDRPNESILATALHGIGMFITDADRLLTP